MDYDTSQILERLDSIEKKIDTIESNVGTLMGRDESEYYTTIGLNDYRHIYSTSNWCFECNRPKKDCICFKTEA